MNTAVRLTVSLRIIWDHLFLIFSFQEFRKLKVTKQTRLSQLKEEHTIVCVCSVSLPVIWSISSNEDIWIHMTAAIVLLCLSVSTLCSHIHKWDSLRHEHSFNFLLTSSSVVYSPSLVLNLFVLQPSNVFVLPLSLFIKWIIELLTRMCVDGYNETCWYCSKHHCSSWIRTQIRCVSSLRPDVHHCAYEVIFFLRSEGEVFLWECGYNSSNTLEVLASNVDHINIRNTNDSHTDGLTELPLSPQHFIFAELWIWKHTLYDTHE